MTTRSGGKDGVGGGGGGASREMQNWIEATSVFPGFRFLPTDEELISYYLRKKIDGEERCVEVIPHVQICRHEPWDLPAKSIIQSETEWFFFSSRGRKYPNGAQSKRATQLGYWKATGKERTVRSGSAVIGTKRTLVFHIGRAPKGERTEWIMHEYCMAGGGFHDSMVVCRLRKNVDFRGHYDGFSGNKNNEHGAARGEENSKKTSSSSDSYSKSQVAAGGGQEDDLLQLRTLEESTSGLGLSDDFYAEILNDDIVNLGDDGDDQLPEPAPVSESAIHGMAPVSVVPQEQQGTANRRVKLESGRRVGSVAAAPGRVVVGGKAGERREEEEEGEKKKLREGVVAVLFVVGVVVLVVLVALFGFLFGHDRVSGED